MRRRELRRLLLGAAFVAIVLLLALGPSGAWFAELNDLLAARFHAAGPGGVAAFLVLAAFSVLLSVFTSAPVVPAAVLAWGAGWTLVLLLVGWTLGGIGAYAVGRYGGRRLLGRVTRLEQLDRWTSVLPRKRALVLATLVRMTFPSEVAYLFGVLRYPFIPFLLLTLAAEAPTAWVVVYASDALNDRRLVTFGVIVLAAAMLGLGAWIVRDLLLRPRSPGTPGKSAGTPGKSPETDRRIGPPRPV